MPNNSKPHINRFAVMVVIGMLIALGVFISLLVIAFTWLDLAWSLPALAIAALLVYGGARKLKKK